VGVVFLIDEVSITVDLNSAPTAYDQSVGTEEDTGVDITLAASDADGDVLTYSVVDGPTSGVLSGVAPDVTYTPNTGYNGTDSFTTGRMTNRQIRMWRR
jgi:hypothetical protein